LSASGERQRRPRMLGAAGSRTSTLGNGWQQPSCAPSATSSAIAWQAPAPCHRGERRLVAPWGSRREAVSGGAVSLQSLSPDCAGNLPRAKRRRTAMRYAVLGLIVLFALGDGCSAPPNVVGVQDFGHVTGRVLDAMTNRPIPSALVSIGSLYTVRADANGAFLLRAVAGDQTVTARAAGYSTATADATLTKNQTVSIGYIRLVPLAAPAGQPTLMPPPTPSPRPSPTQPPAAPASPTAGASPAAPPATTVPAATTTPSPAPA